MDQMMYTFLITIVIVGMISLSSNDHDDDPKGFNLTAKLFTTDKTFNIASYLGLYNFSSALHYFLVIK